MPLNMMPGGRPWGRTAAATAHATRKPTTHPATRARFFAVTPRPSIGSMVVTLMSSAPSSPSMAHRSLAAGTPEGTPFGGRRRTRFRQPAGIHALRLQARSLGVVRWIDGRVTGWPLAIGEPFSIHGGDVGPR